MRAVKLFLLAGLLGAGVSYQSGRRSTPWVAIVPISGATGVGVAQSTYDAPEAGSVSAARFVITGAGSGSGLTMTLDLLADSSSACSLTIPCDGAEGTEVSASCAADLTAGQDVDWAVTASECSVRPSGNVSFIFTGR